VRRDATQFTRGCDQSERSTGRAVLLDWSLAATANWVTSQRTRWPLSSDGIRSFEMKSDEVSDKNAPWSVQND